MKVLKSLIILGVILISAELSAQYLPESYQPMFNEIVKNFETIRTGNSLTEGKTSLRVINEKRVVLRVEHKKKIKNLTFVTKPDEEGKLMWRPDNQLTIDMVNKYEEYLTKTLNSMRKLSEEKSKE